MRSRRAGGRATRGLVWPTTAAVVLTAVVPVLLVSAIATASLQRGLTERASADLSLLAEAQAGRLELVAGAGATHARLVASRTQLRRDVAALLDGEGRVRDRIEVILGDAVDAADEVVAIALVDARGGHLAGAVELAADATTLDRNPGALAEAEEVWSTTVASPTRDRWLVLAPLHLDGRVLGVAVVELDISSVAAVVHPQAATGVRTCVSRLDADGTPVPLLLPTEGARPACDADVLTRAAADAGTATAELVAALRVDPGSAVDGVDAAGARVLATAKEVEGPGWLAVVSVPRTELLSPMRRSVAVLLVAGVGIALLAGVAAVFLARRITEPVAHLSSTVRAIEAGDLDARADTGGPGELGDLAAGVNRMADAVAAATIGREQRYRDLEVLTHAMAHDLKGPLTTVHGMLELVVEGRATDAQQRDELLARARGASVRMQRIIADLLTLARAQGGELARRPVHLGELIDRVAADLGVDGFVERDELPTVPGDPVLLEHVAQNLLANAVAYHAPGVTPRVVVSAVPTEGGVALRIEDAGVGIPEQEREEVLQPFFRGEVARATRGTGLGLPIAFRAVERHGGRMRIEDAALGGTRLVVWLPAECSAAAGTGQGEGDARREPTPDRDHPDHHGDAG